jgi:hypothetical protein
LPTKKQDRKATYLTINTRNQKMSEVKRDIPKGKRMKVRPMREK